MSRWVRATRGCRDLVSCGQQRGDAERGQCVKRATDREIALHIVEQHQRRSRFLVRIRRTEPLIEDALAQCDGVFIRHRARRLLRLQ